MSQLTRKASPPGSARLFEEAHAAPPAGVHLANIDGASRGNPGPAAYAVILRRPDGTKLFEIGKCIGRETNNVAEYYGLIAALDYAANHGIRGLRVRSDSELLVRQMQGRYRVKNEALKPLFERAQKMARGLDYFAIEHVMREANGDADALANRALDGGRGSREEISSPARPTKPAEAPRMLRGVRARYSGGKFVPERPVEIEEGAKVEMEVRILKKS